MTKEKFDLNNLRIATPCPVGWQNMTGDNRKRFCGLCSLNVYNFSEMTATEVETLVRRSEGMVCARMFRRADGTVITRDCPVGLAAYRRRVSRFAGAALAMVIGLFSAGYGQSTESKERKVVAAAELNINKKPGLNGETRLYGAVLDMYGAVIPGVRVNLVTADGKNIRTATTNNGGEFSFFGLPPGSYTIEIEPVIGFEGILIKDLKIEAETLVELNITLEVSPVHEVVGGLVPEMDLEEIDPAVLSNPPSKEVIEKLKSIAPVVNRKPVLIRPR